MNVIGKLVFAVLITGSFLGTAAAEEKAPKIVAQHNGFTAFDGGFMTLDGDEYDPEDPSAPAMLDYMESIGEIFRVPEPLFREVGGCQDKVYVHVDKSEQNMYVYLDCSNTPAYVWKTSTGKKGHTTPDFYTHPSGRFGKRTHESGAYPGGCTVGGVRYGNMSYAVYFEQNGAYAIHGGCEEERLGEVRSHGCVRTARKNAQYFSELVQATVAKYGYDSVTIEVTK